MVISQDTVIKVARLARIALAQAEQSLFSEQLESILEYIDKLKELDVTEIKPVSHILEIQNIARDDCSGPHLEKEAALKNSPSREKDHFRVPRVID